MIVTSAAVGSLALALAPATLGRASTQIETPLAKPQTGNITVATAHAKLNEAGSVKVTLKKGKHLSGGLSLYARPRRSGKAVNVDLVVTNNRSGGTRALPSASVIAVLNSVDMSGFARSFSADEQSNVFKLPEGGRAEGDICNGKGSGQSRLIAGKHVFSSTDAGQVVKDACSAIAGSRSGGAKKLQQELEG